MTSALYVGLKHFSHPAGVFVRRCSIGLRVLHSPTHSRSGISPLRFVTVLSLQLHEGMFDWMNKTHAKFHWVSLCLSPQSYMIVGLFVLD